MKKEVYIPVIIGLIAILIFGWIGQTISSVWIFIPATVFAFLIYMASFYREMPEPNRIVPLYMMALAVQMLHFAEEYLTDFCTELPKIFGQEPYPVDFWLLFNMIAYFVFILGGIALFRKRKEYAIIPLFFILVGVVFNGAAHLGLALYSGGYFSGLYSAIVYLFLAPFLIKCIFRKTEKLSET